MQMQMNGLFLRIRQSLGMILATLALGALLSGCGSGGFQPMYASPSFGGGKSNLSAVSITSIPGRVGQRIRNELVFQATSGVANKTPKKYRLDVTISEGITGTLVNAEGDAASSVYQINASFRLIDVSTGKSILTGTSFGRAGFERFEAIFSNVRARRDAENRAAGTVAHDIKTRLESFLARG